MVKLQVEDSKLWRYFHNMETSCLVLGMVFGVGRANGAITRRVKFGTLQNLAHLEIIVTLWDKYDGGKTAE